MMQRIGLVAPAPQPPAHRLCTILCKNFVSSGVGGALFTRIIKAYRIVGPGDGGDDCAVSDDGDDGNNDNNGDATMVTRTARAAMTTRPARMAGTAMSL